MSQQEKLYQKNILVQCWVRSIFEYWKGRIFSCDFDIIAPRERTN